MVALLLSASPAEAQVTKEQVWPELDACVRLSHTARLFFLLAPVHERGERGADEAQVHAYVEVGVAPIRAA
jgi:hypothetical protein